MRKIRFMVEKTIADDADPAAEAAASAVGASVSHVVLDDATIYARRYELADWLLARFPELRRCRAQAASAAGVLVSGLGTILGLGAVGLSDNHVDRVVDLTATRLSELIVEARDRASGLGRMQ